MKPGEHKTVQARILGYAEAIGWIFVSREEAEHRRGFDPDVPPADRARNSSLFFDDLLDAKLREYNPRYAEAEGSLLGQFRHLHTDIYGNREFVEHLRNRGKFFDHEERRSAGRFATPSPSFRTGSAAKTPFAELRKKVTFAIFAETDDLARVTAMVDELFTLLEKADRI